MKKKSSVWFACAFCIITGITSCNHASTGYFKAGLAELRSDGEKPEWMGDSQEEDVEAEEDVYDVPMFHRYSWSSFSFFGSGR